MDIKLSKMQIIHLGNICKKDGVVIVNLPTIWKKW